MARIVRSSAMSIPRVTIKTGKGITKQANKDECDVNLILAKYQKTGIITHRQQFEPQYDDATGVDFQTAMNLVKSSEAMFNELPSSVRRQFRDSPIEFMNFVNDPANQDAMIEMGLATSNIEPAPEPIPVVITETSTETAPAPT